MARSRLLLAGVTLAIGLFATGPSHAEVGAGAAFEVARGAGALMRSGSLAAEAFGFSGLIVSTGPGVVNSQYGCAVVGSFAGKPGRSGFTEHGSDQRVDIGCGRLSLTVDPLLQAATLKGTLRSWLYNFETGEEGERSSIVVNLTFAGVGLIRPILTESEYFDARPLPPAAFLFVAVGTGAGRDASAKGSVTSAALGAVEGATEEAAIFEGANVYLDAFAY